MAAVAIPLTVKALAYARGLLGLGVKNSAARAAAVAGGQANRAIGTGLRKAGSSLANAAGTNTTERIQTLAPDLFFGGMTALNTGGDLGDAILAGGSDAILGGVGGIGLTAALGGRKKLGSWAFGTDMLGSVGGSYAGMAVGDNLLRAKSSLTGGTHQTPYEKLAEEDRARMDKNLLAQYGIGGYNLNQYDPFLAINGLG